MKSPIRAFAVGVLFLAACEGGAVDRIDNRWDCRQICQDFADCANSDYDVDSCAEECRDKANDDDDFESKVGMCEDCLDDDDSCLEDAASCTDECAGVVLRSS